VGKLLGKMHRSLASLYYDPSKPSAFSTLANLQAAVRKAKGKKPSPGVTQEWLHQQDAYTLHKPVRKRFHRNPYTVNNIMDVWEADLLDVQNLSKYNDSYKFVLTVIDVFSKYLHAVPLKTKAAPSVTTAFQSILKDRRYNEPYKRRPLILRTDRGKEFLNTTFQNMLQREGIEFQIYKNPDVKCSVVERVQRTIREKLNKYFTYKNTYRFIDVLPKFIKGYNTTVHSAIHMAPANVTDKDILTIWNTLTTKRYRTGSVQPRFHVGQHVRISKEKTWFAKDQSRITALRYSEL
jgi:transposase InsO family protein